MEWINEWITDLGGPKAIAGIFLISIIGSIIITSFDLRMFRRHK